MIEQNSQKNIVGLIGLGLVGTSLAKCYLRAGFQVKGFDIDTSRMDDLLTLGVQKADSPQQVAQTAGRIVLSLPHSQIVEDVIFGPKGILEGASTAKSIVDTTTGDPLQMDSISSRLQNVEHDYLDACIIGSSKQVLEGGAVVCAGGKESAFTACSDLLTAFSQQVFYMGEAGKGIRTKLVANLILGLHRLVLSEGLLFAEGLGLDLEKTLELLRSSPAASRVMDIKGEKMIQRDYRPQAKLSQHLKDVELILQMGDRVKAPLILSAMHKTILLQGVVSGLGEMDNCAVIEVLRGLSKYMK